MDVIKYITALLGFILILILGTQGLVAESNKTEQWSNLEAYQSLQQTESLILSLSSANHIKITEDLSNKQVKKYESTSFKSTYTKKRKRHIAKTNAKGGSRKNQKKKIPGNRNKNVGLLSDILHQKVDDLVVKEDSEENVEGNIQPQPTCSFPASKANMAKPRIIKFENIYIEYHIWAKKGMSEGRSWFHSYYDMIESLKKHKDFRALVQKRKYTSKSLLKECDVDSIFIGRLYIITIDKDGRLGIYLSKSQKDYTDVITTGINNHARSIEYPIDCSTNYHKICRFLQEYSAMFSMIPGILDHNLKKKLEKNGSLLKSNMTIESFLKRSAKSKRLRNA